MSVPVIPPRSQDQALVDLLESVALEETALAHFVNAEAEKIQALAALLLEGQVSTTEVISLQRSVAKAMQVGIKLQMLLQFKTEYVLEFMGRLPPPEVFSNIATAIGFYNGEEYADTDIAYYNTGP